MPTNTDTLKTQICDALAAFIRQRPGLEPGNYIRDYTDKAGIAAYRSEQRSIARDKRDAETLLQAVRGRDAITAEHLIEAAKHAFSGRLTITVETVTPEGIPCLRIKLDYCTGQYWPTEYRKAVAAVCAAALWDWQRENMPKPREVNGERYYFESHTRSSLNAGEWLRRRFRAEFGGKLQKRWFD